MKLTLYSNYLTHHQLPLCLSLYEKLGNDFVFCAYHPTAKERLAGGWEDMNNKYPFVLKRYESKEAEQKALELAETSDVIILGDSSNPYRNIRMKNGKFFFRETERFYKVKMKLTKYLHSLVTYFRTYRNEKNGYLLCMGAYVKKDFNSFLCYRHRTLKFGYFPPYIECNINNVISSKIDNSFLWVGRFIKWKHPEYVVKLAIKLKQEKCKFKITMLGSGEMFSYIKSMIDKNDLNSYITLIASVNYKEVSKYYLSSKYHLFTSDRQEGWGAVLNESMNCGCVAIANKEIGSVPYLIKDKYNGLIYNKTYKSFEKSVIKAINFNESKLKEIAINAHNTIKNEWNAEKAANEIIRISELKLSNKRITFEKNGICSKN